MSNIFLTVKAFVCREGEETTYNDDVRKFVIDKTCCGSFGYLRQKLVQMMPELKGKQFTITWRDNDGDNVTMTNDEELMVALMEVAANSVLKIKVTVKPTGKKEMLNDQTGLDSGGVHLGVECDGCGGVVRGNRYKCQVCPDFDLCKRCEMAGKHLKHKMMRIPYPVKERTIFEGYPGSRKAKKGLVRVPLVKMAPRRCPMQCNRNMPLAEILKDCCDPQMMMEVPEQRPSIKDNNVEEDVNIIKQIIGNLVSGKDEPSCEEKKAGKDTDEDYVKYINGALADVIPQILVLKELMTADNKEAKADEETNKASQEAESENADKAKEEESKTDEQSELVKNNEQPPAEDPKQAEDSLYQAKPCTPSPKDLSPATSPKEQPEQWVFIQDEAPTAPTATELPPVSSAPLPLTTLAALTALANPCFVNVTTTTTASPSTKCHAKEAPTTTQSAEVPSKSKTTQEQSTATHSLPASPSTANQTTKPENMCRSMPKTIPIALYPLLAGGCAATADVPAAKTVDEKVAEAKATLMGNGFSDDGGWLTKLIEAKQGDVDAVMKALSPFAR